MRNQRTRKASGQAIIESACGLVVLVLVFVALVMFGVNFYTAAIYGAKLQVVANETVRVFEDNRLWLGVPRPDYNPQKAKERARTIGRELAQIMGLPNGVNFDIDTFNRPEGIIARATASLALVNLPFGGGYFPVGIPISATSVSAEGLAEPYAVLHFDAPISKDGVVRDGVALPVYGFWRKYGYADKPGVFQPPADILGLGGLGMNFPQPQNFRGLPLASAKEIQDGQPAGIWFKEGLGQGQRREFP